MNRSTIKCFEFWATVCIKVLPVLSDNDLSVLSVCLSVCLSVTFVHSGQTVGRIKMKLGVQAGLGPGHIVLDGDPASPPQRGTAPPNFRSMSVVAKRLDGSRGHLVGK